MNGFLGDKAFKLKPKYSECRENYMQTARKARQTALYDKGTCFVMAGVKYRGERVKAGDEAPAGMQGRGQECLCKSHQAFKLYANSGNELRKGLWTETIVT